MQTYKVIFRVDNRRTEQIVSANSQTDAKRLIEMQYSGHKVSFLSVTRI